MQVTSIEPSSDLRKIAIQNGIKGDLITPGDAYSIPFANGAFDLVCAFGVFHHLEDPNLAMEEMKRVSRKFLYFSDSNNYGQGRLLERNVKLFLRRIHLWRAFVFLKTRGRKYTISVNDGLAYSFSLLDTAKHLQGYSLKFMSTRSNDYNFLRTATHLALFAEKKEA